MCDLFSLERLFVHLSSQCSLVEALMEEMQDIYNDDSRRARLLLPPEHIELGQLVAARWRQQGWHRAEVTGFRSSVLVEVCYVDWGTRGAVHRTELHALLPYLLEVPPLALPSSLHPPLAPRHPALHWHAPALHRALQELLQPGAGSSLWATVRGEVEGRLLLELNTKEGEVGEILVRQGLAVRKGGASVAAGVGEQAPEFILSPALVRGLSRRLRKVLRPQSLFPMLAPLVEEAALLGGEEGREQQGRLVGRTLGLVLGIVNTVRGKEKQRIKETVKGCSLDSGITRCLGVKEAELEKQQVEAEQLDVMEVQGVACVESSRVSCLVPRWRGRNLLAGRLRSWGVRLDTARGEAEVNICR